MDWIVEHVKLSVRSEVEGSFARQLATILERGQWRATNQDAISIRRLQTVIMMFDGEGNAGASGEDARVEDTRMEDARDACASGEDAREEDARSRIN